MGCESRLEGNRCGYQSKRPGGGGEHRDEDGGSVCLRERLLQLVTLLKNTDFRPHRFCTISHCVVFNNWFML